MAKMPLAQLSQLGCHTVIGIWRLKWQKDANRAPWSPSIFFRQRSIMLSISEILCKFFHNMSSDSAVSETAQPARRPKIPFLFQGKIK